MAANDLTPRQYKRIGRISEKNPERASKVADKMIKKDNRLQSGKDIVKAKQDPAKQDPAFRRSIMTLYSSEDKQRAQGRDYPLSSTPQISSDGRVLINGTPISQIMKMKKKPNK